ncbi:ParB/Srx family N-terminal domain-containing protein [Methanolobus chelungpuianus]|uniref:ParB/Sulfiredoxin domain-containing protein n=1 Tax=Methanolobus chelungpuianus TaxID=502115 RepID=A0AAE3KWW6_9EURY|nr:ParB/Srx family N-terminal domain-containing protein [Methanolobus chelungpuianus]MCQ6962437.1 hypothetical protein [Methanolobus chelungpuianus]
MASDSILVKIGGISTEIKMGEIEIDQIIFDEGNPRIGFHKDTQPFTNLSQNQIIFALSNKNRDAYAKLKENIEVNEGIVNPIWIEPIDHEIYRVIEGNTRLLIYRDLREKYPYKDFFKTIPCRILPAKITEEQRNFIRLEAHLRGTTPWDAYEKARYLFFLWNKEGYTYSQLANQTKLTEKEIVQSIQAFRDMEDQYLPKYGNDPSEVLKFSYFVEYEKNNKLKDQMNKIGLVTSDFCDWVGNNKISKAQDVREIYHLLESDQVREIFIKEGFEEAKEILGTIKPCLVDPLYQNIENVIEDIKNIPSYQISEMREGQQQSKKELILKLRDEVNRFVDRYLMEENT